MMSRVLLFSAVMGHGGVVAAQEHVHGQGQILVSQEGRHWQVQVVLPGADVLGFEHAPENQTQKERVQDMAERFQDQQNVMHFDTHCAISGVTHSLILDSSAPPKGIAGDPRGNLRGNKNLGLATKAHHDINLQYRFLCTQEVSSLTLTMFQWLPSLQRISAQWSTDDGQGVAILSANKPVLAW